MSDSRPWRDSHSWYLFMPNWMLRGEGMAALRGIGLAQMNTQCPAPVPLHLLNIKVEPVLFDEVKFLEYVLQEIAKWTLYFRADQDKRFELSMELLTRVGILGARAEIRRFGSPL